MERMPVLFVGHGSPMNAIEDNQFSATWTKLGKDLPRPQAILSISAHWMTPGTRVMDTASPRTIYDMYGFPEELYRVVYAAPGAPEVAQRTKALLGEGVQIDNTWGLDHGTWSVLRWMYPQADIPVFQLSLDRQAGPRDAFLLGQRLRPLRRQGVLVLGSGNVVHNLLRMRWEMEGGFPWALAFDGYIKDCILKKDSEGVIEYRRAGESAALAFPTLEHFLPLLFALGASEETDGATVFNEAFLFGSVSMTGYVFAQGGAS